MKDITSVEFLAIPEGVTVVSKARTITVEGPRGKLVKRVAHIQMDIQVVSICSAGIGWDEGEQRGCMWDEERRQDRKGGNCCRSCIRGDYVRLGDGCSTQNL